MNRVQKDAQQRVCEEGQGDVHVGKGSRGREIYRTRVVKEASGEDAGTRPAPLSTGTVMI